MSVQILHGNCRAILKTLPAESVHCVVTSPPYWGLRDYGVDPGIWGGQEGCKHQWAESRYYTENSAAKSNGCAEAFSKPGPDNAQRLKDARWREEATCTECGAWRGSFGLERSYASYIEHSVEIFREVARVLRPDGTLWLNLGDSYTSGGRGTSGTYSPDSKQATHTAIKSARRPPQPVGLKPKDLVGIPWRVAFALQADGWYLRSDIIWSKPNPMPESVTDRPTKAHEYLFLFAKSERYFYDAEAIKERAITADVRRPYGSPGANALDPRGKQGEGRPRNLGAKGNDTPEEVRSSAGARFGRGAGWRDDPSTVPLVRNKRSVWEVATEPFPDAHFAVFPPALIEPCILAGCPERGTVLDPFGGSGTTGMVADRLNRNAILIELNFDYAKMASARIAQDAGMFAEVNHG